MPRSRPYKRIRISEKTARPKDTGRLLSFLVQLAEPVMRANKIRINDFYELQPDDEGVMGVYAEQGKDAYNLGILLKEIPKYVPDKIGGGYWRQFADLCAVILHELSHAYLHQHKGGNDMFKDAGHDQRFYKQLYVHQHQYYEAYTGVHAKLSTFVPSWKTIAPMYKKYKPNSVSKSIGMDPAKLMPMFKADFIVSVRQWAIERKLDSESAALQGKKLPHYKGTGKDDGPAPTGRSGEQYLASGKDSSAHFGHSASASNRNDSSDAHHEDEDGIIVIGRGSNKIKQLDPDVQDIVNTILGPGNSQLSVRNSKGSQPLSFDFPGKDSSSFSSFLRSKFWGIFATNKDKSCCSKGYNDKDGYMGLVSHPKNEKFAVQMAADIASRTKSGSNGISSNCRVYVNDRPEFAPKFFGSLIDVTEDTGYSGKALAWTTAEMDRAVDKAKAVALTHSQAPDGTEDYMTDMVLSPSKGYDQDEALSRALAESARLSDRHVKMTEEEQLKKACAESAKEAKAKSKTAGKPGLSSIFGRSSKSQPSSQGESSKISSGSDKDLERALERSRKEAQEQEDRDFQRALSASLENRNKGKR